MKYSLCVISSVLLITACNKGTTVELKNATGTQVAQAVKQSGVMASGVTMEPGLWESKADVQEMTMPGMPPQFAARMKQNMAQSRNDVSSHCVTADELKKPEGDFFGADKSCKYQHFTMGGGKIDAQMVCSGEGASQTTNLSGSYTPTTYSMDISTSSSSGGHGSMSMKLHVDSRRVGECTGKEG